jgi:3',5'-cyclic AMP phosphodiesterase CpdA
MKKTDPEKKNWYLRYLAGVLICLVSVSCNKKPDPDLHFAFIGDIHYSISDIQTTDHLVQSIAGELHNLKVKPEFIIHTGDFFHGGRGSDTESEAAQAFSNFGRDIGMPFFNAKGNHDSRIPFEKNALPLISRELGNDAAKSYYSFDKANCHFIILDCTDENLGDQLLWLENDLKNARSDPGNEHIFAAGHYPLWIVARAGFTRPEYATPVASLLAEYEVDAYFCGHTHNKTATVRLVNGKPFTQLMDAAVVEKGRLFNLAPFLYHVSTNPCDNARPGIFPLDEGHQIFIPGPELEYYWGYQEGSTTSYYVITVDGKSVQADWHVLGQGPVRSFKWDQPGRLVNLKSPEKPERDPLSESDLKQVSKAWLFAAPWIDKDSVTVPFSVNGIPAGIFRLNRTRMAGSPFWNKIEVPLSQPATVAIRMKNEISISNPQKGNFGLAHIFLLVQFRDGRFARSDISQKVLTSFDPSEGEYANFPSGELISPVNPGEPLKNVILTFDRFY